MRFTILCLCISSIIVSRSIHRPQPSYTPYLSVHWANTLHATSQLYHDRLQYWPIFTRFDYDHVMHNQLPDTAITYRYDHNRSVTGTEMSNLLHDFMHRLSTTNSRHAEIGSFKILKDRDFNYKYKSGVLILKCKDHPFVVKLFIETPETLTKPYSKGIEPCFFFSMTGGISRFFAGFTRIKNKHSIIHTIEQLPAWRDHVTVPRKWFWIPSDVSWISIHGHHIAGKSSYHYICVPGTYAVISDAMETDQPSAMFTSHNRKIALNLTRDIGNNRLDPHIDNFMIEKDTNKIAIIDTEHFASMTGMHTPMKFSSYKSWYLKLSRKCFKDLFLKSKRDRNAMRNEDIPSMLIVEDTYATI